ncbi:hypothetical protein AHAS_Ahas10G0097600 [Arachis hypogaea]
MEDVGFGGVTIYDPDAIWWNNEYDSRISNSIPSQKDATKYIKWTKTFYDNLAPYVSKLPRRAYLNYRNLDLGVNGLNTSYVEAQSCGLKYFNHNFKRLIEVKVRVDPRNFFKNAQSIPIGDALVRARSLRELELVTLGLRNRCSRLWKVVKELLLGERAGQVRWDGQGCCKFFLGMCPNSIVNVLVDLLGTQKKDLNTLWEEDSRKK